MRIVVVEDEVLVRKGILSGIPWEENGIQVVGDAADGRSGLELIRRLKPDMVVTDIQMPIMDGLEMIRHVRQELPDTAILILSVREDFRAVQEALRLGVIDYVHKLTMSPEELLESVLQAKAAKTGWTDEGSGIPRDDSGAPEARLAEWLSGNADERGDLELATENSRFVVGIVRLPAPSGPDLARRLLRSAKEPGLRAALLDAAAPDAAFLAIDAGTGDGGLAERWAADLESGLRKLGDEGGGLSVGLSAAHTGAERRVQAYQEALAALGRRFYAGPGHVHLYAGEAISGPAEEDVPFAPPVALKAYLAALEQTDGDLAARRFGELFPALPPEGVSPRGVRERMLQWQSAVSMLLGDWGLSLSSLWTQESPYEQLSRLDHYADLREWCWRLHTVARELWDEVSNTGKRAEIEQALRYMKEHYRKPLKLHEIAASVNLSENYFSYLFSKSTGQSFLNFLHELRVNKAKELLREGSTPWYEVGEKVGFDNPKYFSKIFKRHADVTPAQFQRNK